MRIRLASGSIALACAGLCFALPALAQTAPAAGQAPAGSAGAAPAPAAADAATEPRRRPEPNVQHIVSEDDNVRIEELRVRGQTTQIVVQSKAAGGSRYEILPGEAGRDPSLQDKRSAGQRVWRLFSF